MATSTLTFAFLGLSLVAQAPETPPPDTRSYDAGDLGLDKIDDQEDDASGGLPNLAIGVSTVLLPAVNQIPGAGTAAVLQPSLSVRFWQDDLMIEPIGAFGFRSSDPTLVRLNLGALFGLALADGPLRPIVGGGAIFGLAKAADTDFALTFGPMFALEYRFPSMPRLSIDAAMFLPVQIDVDPFELSLATSGGALVGFHYYLGS